jgi:hypothetical protein
LWISLGLLAILLTHLVLHWQWAITVVARQLHLATNPKSQHVRSGLIALAVLAATLGLFAWVTQISVRQRDDPYCPAGEVTGTALAGTSTSGTNRSGERGKVSFWNEVYPVLETSCLSCHGPVRARGGFRVDRQEDYFGKDGNEPLVVPGMSDESPLMAIVSGQRTDMAMAARHKLPEPEVAVLRAWIDAGAEWPEKREAE